MLSIQNLRIVANFATAGGAAVTSMSAGLVGDSGATDGVAVTAYGRGQLVGATFTAPAHSKTTVSLKLKLQCVTPDNVKNMNNMIRGLLEASKQHEFDELEHDSASGGLSFMSFFSGGASASHEDTKKTMDKWGLSEENQKTIVTSMCALANTMNEFDMDSVIDNSQNDFSVSGNLFGIVMDATINQGTASTQVRVLAPKASLVPTDGSSPLPVVAPLY